MFIFPLIIVELFITKLNSALPFVSSLSLVASDLLEFSTSFADLSHFSLLKQWHASVRLLLRQVIPDVLMGLEDGAAEVWL